MWWDKQNLVKKADDFLESTDSLNVFYYMTMGNEGGAMLGGAMKLAASKAGNRLMVEFADFLL